MRHATRFSPLPARARSRARARISTIHSATDRRVATQRGRRRRGRRVLQFGLALGVAMLMIGPLGLVIPLEAPAPARAAEPTLTVVGATRYEAQPDDGRILVTADLTIRNHAVDTATTRYFYDQAFLAVPPEATSFVVTGGLGRSNWTISERKPTYTLLSLTFGGRLAAGASTKLRLTFALEDPGDPPDRELRVSRTLITFPVWALASTATAGSTVTVSVPAGYNVTFLRGTLPGPTTDAAGDQVWTSEPIPDPLKVDLYVRADRPLQFLETERSVTVDATTATLTFRSWIDDSAWLSRMEDMFGRGVPALAGAIGLPWPLQGPLTIEEALNPANEALAGSFDPANHVLQVAYNAGAEVALHEAAHAWFNSGLLADRWADEAFASYYAEQAAAALDLPFEPAVLTPQIQAAAVPLNAWGTGADEPAAGAGQSAPEAFGYAASAELARQIAAVTGPAGLQRVWAAIGDRVAPYQPPGGPAEELTAPPDWRGLLDLLEDDGTTHVAGLWATYVVRPEEASMLANRTVARRAYFAAVEQAGDWGLPRAIRDAMRAWQFDVAAPQLSAATAALDARDALAGAAASAGLTMPATLQNWFTEATDLAPVATLIKDEGDAVTAIAAARRARPADIGPVEWVGMLGAHADELLDSAVAAFERADPATAGTDAAEAEAIWVDAGNAGRIRVVALAIVVLIAVLATSVIVVLRRRTRHD